MCVKYHCANAFVLITNHEIKPIQMSRALIKQNVKSLKTLAVITFLLK